jgi:hypothetical protein
MTSSSDSTSTVSLGICVSFRSAPDDFLSDLAKPIEPELRDPYRRAVALDAAAVQAGAAQAWPSLTCRPGSAAGVLMTKPVSPSDLAIWDELDDMSRHMLDPTIPWTPATPAEQGFADLIAAGEIVDSGERRPRRDGKQLFGSSAPLSSDAPGLQREFLRP